MFCCIENWDQEICNFLLESACFSVNCENHVSLWTYFLNTEDPTNSLFRIHRFMLSWIFLVLLSGTLTYRLELSGWHWIQHLQLGGQERSQESLEDPPEVTGSSNWNVLTRNSRKWGQPTQLHRAFLQQGCCAFTPQGPFSHWWVWLGSLRGGGISSFFVKVYAILVVNVLNFILS